MITIKIKKWSRAYKISVSVHSGYAAAGSDIVCVGVSALAYALATGLNAVQHENRTDPQKALIEYSAKWSAQDDVWVWKVISSIENGLEWIANQHPENLKIEVEDMGKCSNHEKVKEIAEKLNGISYGKNVKEIEAEARKHGIVIVMGASDDLMEFSGAIEDEGGLDCGKGGKVYFDCNGVSQDDTERNNVIEAIWCGVHDDTCIPATWVYKTEIPHERFNVFEDEELYCIGIVFSMDDLK